MNCAAGGAGRGLALAGHSSLKRAVIAHEWFRLWPRRSWRKSSGWWRERCGTGSAPGLIAEDWARVHRCCSARKA